MPHDPRHGKTHLTTLILVALVFALFAGNLFYCWQVIDPHPSVDGPSYLEMAAQFRAHGNFAGFHLRSPGYPLFLALFMNARGEVPLPILTLVQTALLFAAALVFWYGLVRLSRVPAVVAALVAALVFSQFQVVALAQLVATESLALFLMTALVVLYFRGVQWRSGVAWFAFVGLVCGFLALVRPQFYFVVAVLALGLAVKRMWRGLLALCAVALALQGGWLARNYVAYDLAYPTSSVTYGYKEHLVKNDLYRRADFGPDLDPALVAALQSLPPQEEQKRKHAALDAALASATSGPAVEIGILRRALFSAVSTPHGLWTFTSQVAHGAVNNLRMTCNYWETYAVTACWKHHRMYFLIFKMGLQKWLDRWNPWLFALATVGMWALLLLHRFRSTADVGDAAFLLGILWLLVAANAVLSAVVDIPIGGRYGAGTIAAIVWVYATVVRMAVDRLPEKFLSRRRPARD